MSGKKTTRDWQIADLRKRKGPFKRYRGSVPFFPAAYVRIKPFIGHSTYRQTSNYAGISWALDMLHRRFDKAP